MRRRVSFRLECARALSAPPAEFFREISRGFVKVFCGERTSERASERARNSAKLASRLWKLMSCAIRVLVTASPVSSLIFAASRRGIYTVSIIYERRGDSRDSERPPRTEDRRAAPFRRAWFFISSRIRISDRIILHLDSWTLFIFRESIFGTPGILNGIAV